jgi:hypothetical protein
MVGGGRMRTVHHASLGSGRGEIIPYAVGFGVASEIHHPVSRIHDSILHRRRLRTPSGLPPVRRRGSGFGRVRIQLRARDPRALCPQSREEGGDDGQVRRLHAAFECGQTEIVADAGGIRDGSGIPLSKGDIQGEEICSVDFGYIGTRNRRIMYV